MRRTCFRPERTRKITISIELDEPVNSSFALVTKDLFYESYAGSQTISYDDAIGMKWDLGDPNRSRILWVTYYIGFKNKHCDEDIEKAIEETVKIAERKLLHAKETMTYAGMLQ